MIRALLDTNVILDFLLDRQPWNTEAKILWQGHLDNQFAAYITATSLTDIFYIGRRHAGKDKAWLAIQVCLDQLYIAPVGFNELQIATTLEKKDFEDNLQIACARTALIDVIITRDPSGFAISTTPILTPQQMIEKYLAKDKTKPNESC